MSRTRRSSVSTRPGRTSRHRRSAAFTTAVMFAMSVLLVGPSLAAHPVSTLAGSTFEIDNDANLVADDPPALDWASPGLAAQIGLDAPSGQSDDSLKGSEDTACPERTVGSIQNNKSDLREFGIYIEPHPSDATHPGYLNLFWTRVQEPTGTTNISVEFNQSTGMCTYQKGRTTLPGVTPARTEGDRLVTYDIDQGGSVATVAVREWTGSLWGPEQALSAVGDAAGTINSSTITTTVPVTATNHNGTTVSNHALGPYTARTFGEAQVDLNVIFDEDSCESFGTAYLKSRSSSSFTASLSDFIAPQSISLTNCGRIVVEKVDESDSPLDGAEFTVTPGQTTNGSTATSSTMTAANSDGVFCLDNLLMGVEYTVSETVAPEGYSPAEDQTHTVTQPGTCAGVTGSTTPDLTFVNIRDTGSILVIKTDEEGGLLGGAQFEVDGEALAEDPPGVHCIDGLPTGETYTVSETVAPTGYEPVTDFSLDVDDASTCAGRLHDLDLEGDLAGQADAVVPNEPSGRTVTVTKVKKDTDVPLEGFTFTLFAGHGADPETDDAADESSPTGADGETTFLDVAPGAYTVCETGRAAPADYWSDGGCQDIDVQLGEDLEVTFENEPLSKVDITFHNKTGYTTAVIDCGDAGNTSSTTEDETDTLTLDHLPIGEYQCTVTIANGAGD